MKRVANVCLASVLVASLFRSAPANAQAHYPALGLSPLENPGDDGANQGQFFYQGCLNTSQWPTVIGRTDFYGNADWSVNADSSDADQQACFANLNAAGVQLSLEVGVLKAPQCPTAQDCWNIGNPWWQRTVANGAHIGAFYLDEPLFAALSGQIPGCNSFACALEQTQIFISWLRATYAGAKIIEIEPYPAIDAATLQTWVANLDCCGDQPDYFEVDHDISAGGNYLDLTNIENTTHAYGMWFSMLMAYTNPTTSTDDTTWMGSQMYQGQLYQTWGIYPDMYHESAFCHVPRTTVPEGQLNTFMNTTLGMLNVGYIPW